jgi:hypothetical protein
MSGIKHRKGPVLTYRFPGNDGETWWMATMTCSCRKPLHEMHKTEETGAIKELESGFKRHHAASTRRPCTCRCGNRHRKGRRGKS